MMQQSLLDELSGVIRLGLEERSVPITKEGWVIEWASGPGWQLTVRLVPGIPLLAAANQLIVFREEEEIRPILEFLPPPPFSSLVPSPMEFTKRASQFTERRADRPSIVGIKDMGELRAVRESVMDASLKLDPDFFFNADFRASLANSEAALKGVVEALDDLIDRLQDLA